MSVKSRSSIAKRHPFHAATALVFSNEKEVESLRMTNVFGDASSGGAWSSASTLSNVSDQNSDKTPPSRVHPPFCRALQRKLDIELRHSNLVNLLISCIVAVTGATIIVYLLFVNHVINFFPSQAPDESYDFVLVGKDSFSSTLAEILYYVIIALLALQMFEYGVKIAIWRCRLIGYRAEMFDLFVLCLSVTSMIVTHTIPEKRTVYWQLLALAIWLRVWRFGRVINGLLDKVRQESDNRVNKERRARKALQREVAKLREYCMQQEYEMQMYRLMLQQNGSTSRQAPPPMPPPLPPPTHPFSHGRTLHVIAEVNSADPYCSSSAATSTCSSSNSLQPSPHQVAPPEYSETDLFPNMTSNDESLEQTQNKSELI